MTQLNKDNRGLSLVELIVALLILTIIFTPTFTAFSVSLKLTTEAKNEFYGATVADNVMEVLKYKMSTGEDMAQLKDSLSSLAGQVEESKKVPTPIITTVPVDGQNVKQITYSIPAYTEGTAEYRVDVELTDYSKTSAANRNLNEKQFANMSAFNDTTTALINPAAVAGGFDSAVVDYFGRQHSSYFDSLDRQEIAFVNQHNIDVQEDYSYACIEAEMEGRPAPTPPPTAPANIDYNDSTYWYHYWQMPSSRTKLTNEEMTGKINKDVTLKIEYKQTERLGYQYILNSQTDYVLKNIPYNQRGSVGICDADNATLDMPCYGYCDDVYYDDLNNVYILYTPMGYYPGNTVKLENEKIKITNLMSVNTIKNAYQAKTGNALPTVEPLNLFIVIQVEAGKTLDTSTTGLTIECDGLGDRQIKVYSQVPFSFAAGASTCLVNGYNDDVIKGEKYVEASDDQQRYSLITASKPSNRIYNATVTVYDSTNKVVATLNSALTE